MIMRVCTFWSNQSLVVVAFAWPNKVARWISTWGEYDPSLFFEGKRSLLISHSLDLSKIYRNQWSRYDFARGVDPDLKSKDPTVVASYIRKEMMKTCPEFAKAVDIDEIARQFVEQEFSSIYQVHCNYYHSLRLKALLCGDAAHGTLYVFLERRHWGFSEAHR